MAEADIVDRLRDGSVGTWNGLEIVDRRPSIQDIREAADTIERLTSQLAEARGNAIAECAQVAAISASAAEDHGDTEGAFMAREIEGGVRALLNGGAK